MSDTPAVSLREARQREARILTTPHYAGARPIDAWDLAAARRATDEALVRAVLRHMANQPYGNLASADPSAVLDAVEREEAGR